ncbi:MAG: hypothetical protein ACYCWE_02885 [Eubacteriales bacterium]
MKYIVYCNSDKYEFSEEVDSLEDSYIRDIVQEQFEDEIHDALDSFRPEPCGYFSNVYELSDNLYNAALEYIEKDMLKVTLYGQEKNDLGQVVNEQRIDLIEVFEMIIENRRSGEQSYIDEGQAVLDCLEEFLKQSVWQFGLQNQDGFVNTNLSMWPKPFINGDSVIWHDVSEVLSPIIWFGLKNNEPIECWTLSKKPEMFEVLDYMEPYNIERWKSFWFNKFWTFDWNILFGGQGDNHITWMFAECGMGEPSIDDVLSNCPILLDASDTVDILKKKIDDFFLKQWHLQNVCGNNT